MARSWRKEAVRSGGGVSWRLVGGRNDERQRINLGRVSEAEAELGRTRMQAEEDAGRADELIAVNKANPKNAIRALLGHQGMEELLKDAPKDYGAMTLAEYHQEAFWPKRIDASSQVGVAEATWKAEEGYWRHKGGHHGDKPKKGILDGPLGMIRLRDLTDQDWEQWQEAQTQLSPRAKVLRRNAYAALLGYARRMGHIKYKPEFFRIKGATLTTRPKEDPLTLDEVRALLDAALDGGRPLYKKWNLSREQAEQIERDCRTRRAMWALAIGAGLRPGELVRVDWSDFDWKNHVLRVRGTKTVESAASIPLTPFAYREMKAFRAFLNGPKAGPCFLVRGKAIKQFKNALEGDKEKARIERKVTPYLLRHSFATLAWSLDVPQEVARRIMRHTDNNMLDRIYCRPRPQDLVARAAKFDLDPPESPTPPTEPGGAAPTAPAAGAESRGAPPKARRRPKKSGPVTPLAVQPEA